MKLLLPVLLALIGLGGGVAAGWALRPPPPAPEPVAGAPPAIDPDHPPSAEALAGATLGHGDEDPHAAGDAHAATAYGGGERDEGDADYVRLDKQFVVPVVRDSAVQALIILSLSLEVDPATRDQVFTREPKLRDVFLRALFQHAHSGGFDGVFTGGAVMGDLRLALLGAARGVLGEGARDVLVTDIMRQDL